MKNPGLLIIVLAAARVLGQQSLGRFTESPAYNGQVYKYQPQHTRILQLSVEPLAINPGPPELRDVVYFSNDIDSQFYLHSRTGYVMVDAIELTEGNYSFTAYANYTAVVGDAINTAESLSVMVVITVMPEFYFAGTEQDGSYLAYASTNLPVDKKVTRIKPQFTLLNQTMFNCSFDGEESSSLPIILTPTGYISRRTGTSNAGLLEFGVLCLAYGPSSVVIESLRVHVTILFYQPSDLEPSDLTFNSTSGVSTWTPPQATRVNRNYQNLFPLANYEISVGVANGDESSVSSPISLSPSANNFTHHPLIPRTNLTITLTAVFVGNITGSLTTNAITAGVDLAPPQSIRISDNSHVVDRLTVSWEPPSSPPVNIIGYTLRLLYVARAPHHYEFVFTELMQNQPRNASAYDFNRLPGNTSYCAIVVALYSNGQRVPASPVQYMLPGYAPSDSPDIVMAEFMPGLNTVMVIWSTLFFSNGEITNYTIQLVYESIYTNITNVTMTVTGNNVTSRNIIVRNGFINATVRASNRYGDGPVSPVRRISTSDVPVNIRVENITDTSACFIWSSPPDTRPFCYFIQINGYQVATTVKTSYCEMQIAPDSVGRVNIGAIYQQSNSSLSSPVMFHTVQAPHNLTAFNPNNVSVTLEWSPPEFPNAMESGIYIERYELNINNIWGFPGIYGYPVNGYSVSVTGTNSLVFGNLLPGVTFNLTLVAVFSNSAVATSSPVIFNTSVYVPPNVGPTNLSLLYNISSTLAVFQWDPVLFSNGPVTGYRVYIGDSHGIFVQGAYNTSLEVNVRRNVSKVRVVAINYVGESRVSTVRNISLNASPGALRVHILNVSSIRLFWDPPQLFIVDFKHYFLNIFFNDVRVVDPVNVIANSYVYTGLYSSSLYSFQVTAVYHSIAVSSNTVSIETPVACNASCQFGGICVAGPNICDCTSVSNSTGGTDDCYGGRANASCNCVCYDGLFTGKNCTESLYGPAILLEPSMYSETLTVIPRTPAVASADILDYRILIYGPVALEEITLSEDMRSIKLNLSVENFTYTVMAQTRFYIPEHDDTFIFNASSDPLTLAVTKCGPNTYGGFNTSDCQPCPENTGNFRGYNYLIESCGCMAGYTGQNGGPCYACSKGTFKPTSGNGACQDCPPTMSSEVGSVICSCASGYEPSEAQCRACMASFYKDQIENVACTPCPQFSDVLATGSNNINNCTCTFSSGTAEQDCYAFESKADVQIPRDHDISNNWVVVSWNPLTSVVDRGGNSLGDVIGFYITVQFKTAKRDAVGEYAINITSGMATSANLTGLQQGSQYDVKVAPYIVGFQLGPPTIITINTLPLGNGSITITSAIPPHIIITPTSRTTDDSSDDGMTMIIIIACAAGGATIALLLTLCCSIYCVVRRRKRSNKEKISESTKKMKDSNNNYLNPVFKKVSPDVEMNVLRNPSFLGESNEKEHFNGKEDPIEYTYEDMGSKPQQGNTDNHKTLEKGNFETENQVYEIDRLATPGDYGNEALYEEMTARYYELSQSDQVKLPEVSRNKVTLFEQLGTGEFGRVLKGIGSEIVKGEPEMIVAVKLLKEGASNDDKKNFLGEANLMSQFHHSNILTLLGVVTVDEPVLVIIPFMINGDLQSFLSKSSQPVQLRYEDKLNISVQIASGMEYLAARFFIHRDLAARNILVGDQLHVKISDFGLSRALKDDTYYKLSSTTKLPVKWMALESIEYHKFSTFSDVWSYGVVLWEIFSLGMKPYKGVPSMTMSAYLRSGKRLTKPADCTDEIYDLMSQCWLEQKDRRPTFTKLKSEITDLLNKEKN